jgi:aminomethyltransferase
MVEGAPARGCLIPSSNLITNKQSVEGADIYTADHKLLIGRVTSGGPSPVLKKNIGMALLAFGHHKLNTPIAIKVRNKYQPAKVTKMPFVPSRYHTEP